MSCLPTATYLAPHHVGRLAPATAAVHGFSVAFAVPASLFALRAPNTMIMV